MTGTQRVMYTWALLPGRPACHKHAWVSHHNTTKIDLGTVTKMFACKYPKLKPAILKYAPQFPQKGTDRTPTDGMHSYCMCGWTPGGDRAPTLENTDLNTKGILQRKLPGSAD